MPTDELRGTFEVATVEVQVTATKRGTGDFEDGVGGLLDLGIWAIFYRNLRETQSDPVLSKAEIGTL